MIFLNYKVLSFVIVSSYCELNPSIPPGFCSFTLPTLEDKELIVGFQFNFILPYRCYMGIELLKNEGRESVLKSLWHHSDAVMCCSLKVCLMFSSCTYQASGQGYHCANIRIFYFYLFFYLFSSTLR